MSAFEDYFAAVQQQLETIRATQRGRIQQAAGWVAAALDQQRFLYAFGTGHSQLLAEEIFYRAGGLARAAPILDEKLMLHAGAAAGTEWERRESYAAEILTHYPLTAGDVLIVASNSGRNAVPIELALGARARGVKVVAVVNARHSTAFASRHSSGKKLADVADLVIDNGGVIGDACLTLPGVPQAVGPTSTITGAFIVNAIVVEAIALAAGQGRPPEIYASANSDAAARNAELLARYRPLIRHL